MNHHQTTDSSGNNVILGIILAVLIALLVIVLVFLVPNGTPQPNTGTQNTPQNIQKGAPIIPTPSTSTPFRPGGITTSTPPTSF